MDGQPVAPRARHPHGPQQGPRRGVRAVLGTVLGLLAPVLLPGCGEGEAQGGRSILVITMDTTRADHIGAYGYPLPITPHVDALAARGVQFLDAYAPMPQTLPSHATLFTGLDPRQHGALENTYVLDEAYRTLAEQARSRGYRTAAFIGALVLDAATGMAQGFETFDQPRGEWNEDREGHPPQRRAAEVTDAALAWAGALEAGRPFLMWAHYYDPHGDGPRGFDPPPEHLAAVPAAGVAGVLEVRSEQLAGSGQPPEQLLPFWRGYAAEIRYTDAEIGRLLAGLEARGLLADTVVVLAGDHGEGLWEHGIKAHGQHIWQELQRVPLIVVSPDGALAGHKVPGPASLRDVEPTLRRLAWGEMRAEGGDEFGLDLWEAALAGALPAERPVFLERPHFDRERVQRRNSGVELDQDYGYLTAVVRGRYKLVREPGGTLRLFDLERDPSELRDVAQEMPEVRDRLARLLEGWMRTHEVGPPGEAMVLTPEKRAILEELGYL